MEKIYIITRINRFDKRFIKAYKNIQSAIEERNKILTQYPMGNYIIEEIELSE